MRTERNAVIYWDAQDPQTIGWAWAIHYQAPGPESESGALGEGYPAGSDELNEAADKSDADLVAAFKSEFSGDFSSITIDRS